MSKVDNRLNKISEVHSLASARFVFEDGISCYVEVNGGDFIISDNELMIKIEKKDALKFARWIIENYGD